MNCPLCYSESKWAFKVKGYNLLDCVECGHRFVELQADESHVATVYDDPYFTGGGAGYSDYLIEAKMLRQRGAMYAKKLRRYTSIPGKCLDVGAAAGCILQGFVDAGWRGVGLEPNENMAQSGRELFGLDIRQGSLECFQTDEKFDLIVMIQVVAHLYDPRRAFEKVAGLLEEGGQLLIETWNRDSLYAKLLGKYWHEYSPPSVLNFFSLRGLTKFLENFDLEKIAHGRPAKKISGTNAKSLLRYRIGDWFFLNFIPGQLHIPYPSEDLFWALYQRNN